MTLLGAGADVNAKLELGLIEEAIKDYEETLRTDSVNDEVRESLEKARKIRGLIAMFGCLRFSSCLYSWVIAR